MKFTLDEPGLERLLSSAGAEAMLKTVADAVAADWQRFDPRSQPGGHEPPAIDVHLDHVDGVAVAVVSTPDFLWHIIEYGSVNNPPYRPAAKAADNNGLELRDAR